ncbi:flagellar hook-basal body complex protein FliE [Paucibacter oligotrophus]|uniref:Flagellar hook-basal body complex protein FliE n=1 Tax=Roseateles oligotrophus TaxID=1769250 RepID=A0A840LCT8_9BURK|nr:hypothetical protein [Roseateles oligotrophus]MBB4844008.1 flagellar hook-basal body complex protein FliE [Roseateles oligotrophus]
MSIGLSTTLSGISAANERLRASASGASSAAAKASSAEARQLQAQAQAENSQADAARARVLQQVPAASQSAEADLSSRKQDTYAFVANLRVLQSQLDSSGALLNIKA